MSNASANAAGGMTKSSVSQVTSDGQLQLLQIERSIDIEAPATVVFESTLKRFGPENIGPDGPMPMVLEAWPGGRWYRDFGDGEGHFWAHVQVIRPPKLLEFVGPMFMSYPVSSHVQMRFSESDDGTRTTITLTHRAFGMISEDHANGVVQGWGNLLENIAGHVGAR